MKLYQAGLLTFFMAVIVNAGVPSVTVDAVTPAVAWEYLAKDKSRFQSANVKSLRESRGHIAGVSGNDVQLNWGKELIDTKMYQLVEIRMRTGKPTDAVLFYENASGGFAQNNVKWRVPDTNWHTYLIDFRSVESWTGSPVRKFRLDPVPVEGVEFEVESIRLLAASVTDTNGVVISIDNPPPEGSRQDLSFDSSRLRCVDVKSLQVTNENIAGTSGVDAQLNWDKERIGTEQCQLIEIRMRTGKPSDAVLFYENASGGFAQNNVKWRVPDANWHTYLIDFRSAENWLDSPVNKLRLDPVPVENIQIEVAYVRLLDVEQKGSLASLRAAKASRAANLKNIDWLMENMSLAEKVAHMNTGPAGKRGIQQEYDAKYDLPAFAAYDGPRGVKQRGEGIVSFPSGPAVAASWDVSLAKEVGLAFSAQLHQYKGNQIYAPGLNIIKHPLAGRNGEYYSEDPLLTGKIAAAVVQGIQTNGCLATPKHFVCNSYETGRFCTDVTVPERVLREIYLPAFQIVVEEGHPWSLMTAYNSVNGHFMSANRNLLDILYNEWNFQGYVVSDYKADLETAAAALDGGCNVEMPGWTWYNKTAIEQAIHSDTNIAQRFDDVVQRILEIKTSDWIARPEKMTGDSVDLQSQQSLSRRVGTEGAVLLKNAGGILPLSEKQSVALIGPFGNSDLVRGDQGSGTCRTKNLVTLLDALKQSGGDQVTFAEGCSPETGEEEGALTEFPCTAEYFGNMGLTGEPVMVRKEENIQKLSFTGGRSAEVATGVFGNAFQFNGQSLLKAGQIPATAENSDFTWSFWVYLPDQFPRPDAGLISGELFGTNRFVFTPTFFEMSFPAKTGAVRIPYQLPGQIWSHVALVRRSGQTTVYVDGSAVGSAPFRGAVPAIPLSIGGDVLNKKYAHCLIDDIRCYNRVLTESELKSAAQKKEIAGPVFHQSCDDLASIPDQTDSYGFLPDFNAFSARWTAVFVPQKSGKYEFKVFSNGGVRFVLDGKVLYDQWQEAWVEGMTRRVWLDLEKDREYRISVEFGNWFAKNRGKGGFIKLSYNLPDETGVESIQKAAKLAAASDVAVVAVGVPQDPFQGEANDRETFILPGYQDELIRAVAAANTNTIVALFTSGGVDMRRWIDDVPVVMEMFFPGEEAGHCFTDLLYGQVNPSGRLPVTYSKSLNQLAMECVQPVFETSVTGVGYRHFDRTGEEPLFPFGYGLSYTTYEFRALEVNGTKDPNYPATARVTVQNTGKRFGKEVVQVYVSAVDPKEEQPVRELGGFAKIDLKPGETRTVEIPLHSTAFSYYDSSTGRWAPEAKQYIIYAGDSSRHLPLSVEFGAD